MLPVRFTLPAKQYDVPQVEGGRRHLEDGQECPRNSDEVKIVGFQPNLIEQHQYIHCQADFSNSRRLASVPYAKQIEGATENEIDAAGHPPECIFISDASGVGLDYWMKEVEDAKSMRAPGKNDGAGDERVDLSQHVAGFGR